MVYSKQTGFTLIEMIMVIVIAGALAAVAIPKFDRSPFDVEAAAGELIQAIRYAQGKSMTDVDNNKYQISITANSYTVSQNGVDITHPITQAASFSKTWSDISISSAATIVFDGYGEPNAGASFTLSKGANSKTVTVEAVTGFAHE
jgi:MSHA pilin protein MshC